MEDSLACKVCMKRFDFRTREPILVICCEENVCRQCITDRMTVLPDTKGVQCLLCGTILKKTPSKVNTLAKTMLEQILTMMIQCDVHAFQQADYYCQLDQTAVCQKCVIKDHSQHFNECISFDNKALVSSLDVLVTKLDAKQKAIKRVLDNLVAVKKCSQQLGGKEFCSLVKEGIALARDVDPSPQI